MIKNIVVVGAAGRVGLPFTLSLTNNCDKKEHKIIGLDKNITACMDLMMDKFPFIEAHGKQYLTAALEKDTVRFTGDFSVLKDADYICIMIGTPMDSEGNPRLDDLFDFFDEHIIPNINENQKKTIILRSTVAPGTTRLLHNRITKNSNCTNFDLYFCPERISQGAGIVETVIDPIPNLLGCFDPELKEQSAEYILKLLYSGNQTTKLTYEEAEIGKLITNMSRYVEFALVNQYYMIADSYDANINKIIDACNLNYPRLNLPKPGYASGPCLTKDGKFLTSNIPYGDLINTSFLINENFINYIVDKMIKFYAPEPGETIGILGMTFKANNDDIRLSLSFKMLKALKIKGFNVICHDPFWKTNDKRNDTFENVLTKSKIVIMMTNHDCFKEQLEKYMKDNTAQMDCKIGTEGETTYGNNNIKTTGLIDVWRLIDNVTQDGFGIFYTKEKNGQ